jgi:hypothetical protein
MLGVGSDETTLCALRVNDLLPIANVPVYVPGADAEKITLKVIDAPG